MNSDERIESLEKQLEAMKAAHLLLASEEAFIAPSDGSFFFASAEVSVKGTPLLALNMGDVFYYACADCEEFQYEDAPMLLQIAQEEGWPGLKMWAIEQRRRRGEHHTPIMNSDDIVLETTTLKEENRKLKELIASAAPIKWVAQQDVESAQQWEVAASRTSI